MPSPMKAAAVKAAIANIVLYKVLGKGAGDERLVHPLFSCSHDDPFASAKLLSHITREYQLADRQGVPHPEFLCVREERAADEAGKLIKNEYLPLNPATLEALRDKPAQSLAEV